eukprot:540560-Hanusia_phi.AAC.1
MNKVLAIPALRSVFRVPTANFSARVQQQKKRIAKEILKDQAKWNLLLTKPEDLAKLLQGPGRAHAVWKVSPPPLGRRLW